jgi:hypothetical protein
MQITKEYLITYDKVKKKFIFYNILNNQQVLQINYPKECHIFKFTKDMDKAIIYTQYIGLYLLTEKSK